MEYANLADDCQTEMVTAAPYLNMQVHYTGDVIGAALLMGPLIESWNKARLGVPMVVKTVENEGKEIWPKQDARTFVGAVMNVVLRSNPGVMISETDANTALELFKNRGLDVYSYQLSSN